jgi:putative aldouronate transport system substrate-binding protein
MGKTLLFFSALLLLSSMAYAAAEGEQGVADGPVTLTIFGVPSVGRPVECFDSPCNEMTAMIEERFNVKIEWDIFLEAERAGRRDKQQLLLASGDYPAIFLSGDFTNADQMRYGREGILIALNPLIDDPEKSPNIQAGFELKPYIRPSITTPDGNIYSLPDFSECYHCSVAQKAWINTEWLDALGLDMPGTTAELETVLEAFQTGDPNGNGKQDEIPWTGIGTPWWHGYLYDFLMGAFIYNDGERFLTMENGKVGFAADKPEWREGLRYLARLFQKGLLDPQGFTQNPDSGAALANQEPRLLGAFVAGHNRMFNHGDDNWQQYRAIPPLQGPKGVQFAAYYPSGVRTGRFAITDKATQAQIDKAWELADWSYTVEGTMTQLWGLQKNQDGDEYWRWAEPGELGLNGEQAVYLAFPLLWKTELRKNDWGNMWYPFWPKELFNSWAADQDITTLAGYERYLVVESDKYIPYVPAETVPSRLYFSDDDAQRVAQYQTEIEGYVRQNTAAFITGQKDIESDWDAYVEGLKGLGLADYIALTQQAVN